jgi:hypothetical protein
MARLPEVIDSLECSPRQGAAVDDPEGARYVVISETALKQIIRTLRQVLSERPDAEYFDTNPNESSR